MSQGRKREPRDSFGLDPGVAREIDRVAHLGKAREVKEILAEARRAYEEERYEDALEPMARAKKDAPRSGAVRELLGLLWYRLEDWRGAARELAAYRRLSGRRDQDHVYADAERALGRPEKAIDILDRLTPEEAVSEEAWVEGVIVGAGARADLGRPEEGIAHIGERGPVEPEEILPHHLRLWYVLADLLERTGNRAEARGWWDAIYAEDPSFFDVDRRRLGIRSRR
jgi:tetratricopeptide (TPR) repeat protein